HDPGRVRGTDALRDHDLPRYGDEGRQRAGLDGRGVVRRRAAVRRSHAGELPTRRPEAAAEALPLPGRRELLTATPPPYGGSCAASSATRSSRRNPKPMPASHAMPINPSNAYA